MNNPFNALLESDKEKHTSNVDVALVSHSGRYSLGPPKRPDIVHDNGFLDTHSPEQATESDHLAFDKWQKIGFAARKLCNENFGKSIKSCNFEDLSDATAAYLHYLGASGEDRIIDYGKFLDNDSAGKKAKSAILDDAKKHIEIIGRHRQQFSVTSETYRVGGSQMYNKYSSPNLSSLYPQTVNWQRTIGGHEVWISADVSVKPVRTDEGLYRLGYTAKITFHVEDMYNFDPLKRDASTGIPDEHNGRFQIVGLAKQYINKGTYTTNISW